MPKDPPTQPANLPTDIAETLEGYIADQLRAVARYADALAEHKTQTARRGEESSEGKRESDAGSNSRPDDVPARATITVKEIHDNRYYYWQWRDS